VIELDKDNFDAEVKQAKGLVVIDFWGPSCEKCIALMPEVEELAKKYEGQVKFCKMNISGNRRLAMSLGVRGLPAFAFYKDGEQKALLTPDEVSIEAIEAKIKELM